MTEMPARLSAALADRYRLERELGQGGMATVYLAHDLRHDRKVAIKVLRPELAAVLGVERFLSEIRVTANLQHPHILPLFDSGVVEGRETRVEGAAHSTLVPRPLSFLFYVMPFVEGESLRDRLNREKQLGLEEALDITTQMAGALDHAHRQGVLHRDIKPENILLKEGQAILADFGIALAVKLAGAHRLTETGLSLGTPQYMSPEQATGDRQIDARSDVYSLGAVLYEMLAGEPPHTGATVQATIAKLMTERPTPLRVVRTSVPESVDAAVARALAKVPADRFSGTEEFAAALEAQAGGQTDGQAGRRLAGSRSPIRMTVPLLALVALVTIAVLVVRFWLTRRPVAVGDQRQLTFTGDAFLPAISPDGRWLAYVSGDSALMVQEVAGGRAVPVLQGAYFREPVWSPDGSSLLIGGALDADLSRDAAWEVPRLGGEARRVGSNSTSCDYSPDGHRIAWVVIDTVGITDRKTGREIRRLVVPDVSWAGHLRWSPGGRWLALVASTTEWGFATFLVDSAAPTRHLVSREAGPLAWNADGTALYILSGTRIVRQKIDRRLGAPRDSGETVLSGLSDATGISFSRDGGVLVIGRGPSTSRNVAGILPTSGNVGGIETRPLSSGTGTVGSPAMSPDGRWVAWAEFAGQSRSVLLAPFTGGIPRVIARLDGQWVSNPRWAPDSHRFAWFVGDSSPYELYVGTTDAAVPVRVGAIPAGLRSAVPVPFTWAKAGLIVPDSDLRGYQLVDPGSGHAGTLAPFDSLASFYSPLLSPDGRTLMAARNRPFGYWNDVWQRRLEAGRWVPVPSAAPGDHYLLRWDAGGVTAAVGAGNANGYYSKWEVWRSRSPGAPFMPLLTGLRWCTGSPPSLSDDNRHLACTQTTTTSDVWLATGFDGGGR